MFYSKLLCCPERFGFFLGSHDCSECISFGFETAYYHHYQQSCYYHSFQSLISICGYWKRRLFFQLAKLVTRCQKTGAHFSIGVESEQKVPIWATLTLTLIQAAEFHENIRLFPLKRDKE